MAIYKKLLEFQKLGIAVTKDATNPHFKSRYASLNEVLDKVKGPLNVLGVVIVQKAGTGLMTDYGLYTTLIDTEDDSEITCYVPFVGATDMQKLGGAITYARRYSLVTLLGLEDEDDDGNAASTPKTKAVMPVKGTDIKPVFDPTKDEQAEFFNNMPTF